MQLDIDQQEVGFDLVDDLGQIGDAQVFDPRVMVRKPVRSQLLIRQTGCTDSRGDLIRAGIDHRVPGLDESCSQGGGGVEHGDTALTDDENPRHGLQAESRP